MMFARRSNAYFSTFEQDRQPRRPSRACRPALGMEQFEERTLLSIALVSVNAAGTADGNGDSDFDSTSLDADTTFGAQYQFQSNPGALSADGTMLVFASDATDLVGGANETTPASNVFVRNTTTGQTSLVSATPDGEPANGDSFDPVISPNGQYVAFMSVATNLTTVGGQAGGGEASDPNSTAVPVLYVRDLKTQTTTLLDQTPSGQASDGASTGQFVFSPDSTKLAWVDSSDNLTPALVDPLSQPLDLDGEGGASPTYVYVRDLTANTTSLVSVSTDGQASGNISVSSSTTDLVFSPNSQLLVFGSTATDLTTNLPDVASNIATFNGSPENLFVRNLAAGTTTLLSVSAGGLLDVSGDSSGAVFSPDGDSVAFTSDATNLTANGADFTLQTSTALSESDPEFPPTNIFIRDLNTATTTLVTATPSSLQSNGLAANLVFSPDGSKLAFASTAIDLTSNPLDPTPPPDSSALSADGEGELGNIVLNVFLSNLATGTITLVSATPDGMLSSGQSGGIVFSPDGNLLAYESSAGDLTNNPLEVTPPVFSGESAAANGPGEPGNNNVFVNNLTTGTTTLVSATTGGQLSNGEDYWMAFSPDSGSLYFASSAIDLTSNPPDTSGTGPFSQGFAYASNIFANDLSTGATTLITATTGGLLSDTTVPYPFLSPDGQTLYFDSDAGNLTAGDTDQEMNIFAASPPFATPNQFQFQSWESSAQESDGSVVVTVVRSGPGASSASVDYSVEDGTAQSGTDFTATSGTLNFAAGQTSQTFTVPLVPGDDFAGTRSANLVLSNPQGASLGYPSAVLDLTSNPPPPSTPPPSNPPPGNPPPGNPPPSPHVAAPTSSSTSTVTATSATLPGPTVTSVTPVKHRGGITKLVISFDQALDPASAANVANYGVTIPESTRPTRGRHRTAVAASRSIGILAAAYDAADHQVTLTLHTKLHRGQAVQLQIKGTTGGVADTQGLALNSRGTLKQGSDYVVALHLSNRQS
jgi:Tol biopolymer transport system component